MVYSNYVKQRILYFERMGKRYCKIVELLASRKQQRTVYVRMYEEPKVIELESC